MVMSMTQRIQIPIHPEEAALLKRAAQRSGKSLAEWAREHLGRKARDELVGLEVGAQSWVEQIAALNGPIGSIEEMKEESTTGRYAGELP